MHCIRADDTPQRSRADGARQRSRADDTRQSRADGTRQKIRAGDTRQRLSEQLPHRWGRPSPPATARQDLAHIVLSAPRLTPSRRRATAVRSIGTSGASGVDLSP